MALNDLSNEELTSKLSADQLGAKRAAVANAILRRRKAERFKEWLERHGWLARGIAAVRSVTFFFMPTRRNGS
jgi:hypothetical protein